MRQDTLIKIWLIILVGFMFFQLWILYFGIPDDPIGQQGRDEFVEYPWEAGMVKNGPRKLTKVLNRELNVAETE